MGEAFICRRGGTGAGGGVGSKSMILVLAPTGATVTCTMGSTVKKATEKNGSWAFPGLDLGTWTIKATKGADSATQTVTLTKVGYVCVHIQFRITPEFTYTGDYEVVDDSDNPILDFAGWKGNWKIRFLTSGILKITNLGGFSGKIDLFLVGGGGGACYRNASNTSDCGGGGGGYTKTVKNLSLSVGEHTITVGAGGNCGNNGGATAAFGNTSEGGMSKTDTGRGDWGADGGSGGGAKNRNGGSDGSNGAGVVDGAGPNSGKGQGTTTREFGDSSAKPYAGGGGGDNATGGDGGGGTNSNGTVNTGGGGGAGDSKYSGGSGIVIIRNARAA